jgi:hypothetical protein
VAGQGGSQYNDLGEWPLRETAGPFSRFLGVLYAKRDKPLGFPFFILIHLVINTNKQHRKEDYAYKIKFHPVGAFVQ